jgi:hypothetical protein
MEELGCNTMIIDKGKVPILENFHTPESIGNVLAWGDQQILELVYEFVDIQAITYDRKRQILVRRTSRERNLTLDISMVIIIEETLLEAKKDKLSEMLVAGMSVSHATIDKAKEEEREVDSMRTKLENHRHQAYYYKATTQAVMILRDDFL